ncbi:hypothetical protein E3O19_00780 [Cryobacterium algoritolerans]|uniref:Uncharacterized protein n=1 Tax=Cryobacterium algoritolerans TaxID=1259184 RepID=A0A4R8WYF7_9MICO|nr:hypothetical protein [Cryobacterium algoritolerans]TFC20817.1 hypothetical protein E3O19_00780 [Cryobacterium algoritolerans]
MRRYLRLGVVFGVGVAMVLGVAGCSLNAPDAGKTVAQIRVVPILNDPPPDGDLLGRAEYLGSSGPIAQDACVTTVFAAPDSPSALLDYYRRTYPQLEFHRESGTADAISLNGTDGWAYVSVNIQAKSPYLEPRSSPNVWCNGFSV